MIIEDKAYVFYMSRVRQREFTLGKATMDFVAYFMGLGDTQEVAEGKVSELFTEVAALLYVYTLGNTQPLIDGINASALPFMDATAKAFLVGELTPVIEAPE
jgi:hypothetical protein